MSQRRFHTKSRRGCLQCKKNRTKCDEKKPRCGRCERIGSDCSLAEASSDLIFIPVKRLGTRKAQANIESPVQQSILSLSNEHSIISLEDLKSITIPTPYADQSLVKSHFTNTERDRLRLMNHYTLHASKSIIEITIPEDRDQSIWGSWVTELAFEYDFLLHGLLSLSALHLALSGASRQKHLVMAIHHHGLGVELFRQHLTNITTDNYAAVFAFSCIIGFYSFGFQRSSEPEVNAIAKLLQVLTLLRGSSVIVKSEQEKLERSRWYTLMLPIPWQSTQNISDEVEDMLSTLREHASATVFTATEAKTYASTIQRLRDNMLVAATYPVTQLKWTLFPILSPKEFWPMVRNGEPLALAILANYAVVLHWLRKNIWMAGWGRAIVDAVHHALPPEYHDCIAWAIRETEID